MSRIPNQSGSVSMIASKTNAVRGAHSLRKHAQYEGVYANQVSGLGITAYTRFHPPIITNANSIDREEGLISYDQDSERLCYTDSNLVWRCLALFDEVGWQDFVSAMLLVSNDVVSSIPGYNIPAVGYKRLVDWTTAAPRISSPNFDPSTGIFTAAFQGKYKINAQCSWSENVSQNTGIRILRIIHTAAAGGTITIMTESLVNPSPNNNVNTHQVCTTAALMEIGDTIHVEVAQTSGVVRQVEGGATLGSSGTTLQIIG